MIFNPFLGGVSRIVTGTYTELSHSGGTAIASINRTVTLDFNPNRVIICVHPSASTSISSPTILLADYDVKNSAKKSLMTLGSTTIYPNTGTGTSTSVTMGSGVPAAQSWTQPYLDITSTGFIYGLIAPTASYSTTYWRAGFYIALIY